MSDAISDLVSNSGDAARELSLLHEIASGTRITRTPDQFFRDALGNIRTVVPTRAMGVAIRAGRERGNALIVLGEISVDSPRLSRFLDETTELLIDQRKEVLVNDTSANPSYEWLAPEIRKLLVVPLSRDDEVLGFIFAIDRENGDFTAVDSHLLASVASVSAIYLENALLYGDVRGLMMGLLHSLTSAVDAKDSYTCGHSQRVAMLTRQLANAIGLPPAQVERCYISGLLHDVGKIGIPEAVLRKSGKLTTAEFAQMKLHPEIGARILGDIRQLQDILPGVLHHHEHFDGRGYPHGLAGYDIPLMGRLICLADSFDAMTTNRTYRRGMPLPQALAEIRRCAGTHFDPDLVEAFLGLGVDRLLATLDSYHTRNRDASPSVHIKAA